MSGVNNGDDKWLLWKLPIVRTKQLEKLSLILALTLVVVLVSFLVSLEAWLNPVDLLFVKSGSCGICGDFLPFLLQVYVPIAIKETTFHQILFVFMCPSMKCRFQDQHEQWKRRPEKQLRRWCLEEISLFRRKRFVYT